jgi:GNAT superfamily N-acetyltransferase
MSIVAAPGVPRAAAYELITLRPATPADVSGLRALCEAAPPRELGWLADGTLSAAEFAEGAADPRGVSLVALRGEGGTAEAVGLARLCADPDGVAGEFLVLVHASARGRGLGRLLVEHMLADCRRRELLLVRGATLQGNAAMLALARACRFQLLPAAEGAVELLRTLAPLAEDAW